MTGGDGRREPDAQGESVEGVPVLRRIPTATDALVAIDTTDVTAWCPYEGTADYYELALEYQPDEHALELMSYRDYLQTFREETIGHEALAKRVSDDLQALLDPRWLGLTVHAPPRYGLEMRIRHQTGPKPTELREAAETSDD